MPQFAVIIAAGGRSTRFDGRDKLLIPLDSIPVLRRSVDAFLQRRDVASVTLASDQASVLREILPADPRIHFAAAGSCRAGSALSAARAVDPETEWLAIHDGARPLVTAALIDRVFTAAVQHGAVGPALPVTVTVKQATLPWPARVQRTVPREALFAMQTPQVMRRRELLDAFAAYSGPLEAVTDDLQLIEWISQPIHLVAGDAQNIKITEPLDLIVAEAILRSRENGRNALPT